MFEIRQIIQRLRLSESVRQIARSQNVGRATVTSIHDIAAEHGWLDPLVPMPEDVTLAAFFKTPRKAPQNVSSVESFRDEILTWHAQGINATTMRRALHQKHGYTGSVHALYRFLKHEVLPTHEATIKLDFAVGEMAQVDFGMGPRIIDRQTGDILKTWIFVCTLAWSRHQYAEIVRNQSIETWLACHRHAFEWFNGVPR
jgi:transposase